MKRIAVLIIFSLFFFKSFSQRTYFLYLQSENRQPFSVKMNDAVFGSSASGYLVLPNLREDSTYLFSIGFPENQSGEQRFSCNVNRRDHGYTLKNFGEKGWGLVDMQTASVQMAIQDEKPKMVPSSEVSAFTNLLSKAADDSTLKQTIVLPKEEPAKPEVVSSVAQTGVRDSKTVPQPSNQQAKQNTQIKQEQSDALVNKNVVSKENKQPVNNPSANDASGLNKIPDPLTDKNVAGQQQKPDSNGLIKKEDTNSTLNNTSVSKEDKQIVNTSASKTIASDNTVSMTTEKPSISDDGFVRTQIIKRSESSTTEGVGLTFLDIYPDGKQDTVRLLIPPGKEIKLIDEPKPVQTQQNSNTTIVPANGNSQSAPANSITVAKNNCRESASDEDFFRLRKKMAAQDSDDGMVNEAKKVFKVKCFSTEQIKNLSALFLTSGGKYLFFDAAYSRVTDLENFPSLQNELKETYYINRFKAMLGN
jgi:hypothetical protein